MAEAKTVSGMRRIGKVGRANMEANRAIKEITEMNAISYCEMRLEGCMITWPLQIAHRHKRAWYKGEADKLSDFKQWVIACDNCHRKTEWNRELNRDVFAKLRGEE